MRPILFDLDGTLIDSQSDILRAFHVAFEGLGVACPPEERLLNVIGWRLEDCFAMLLGGDEKSGAEGARLFRAWYQEHYLDTTRPYPGVDEALRELALGCPLGLCTMKKGLFARKIVERLGWTDLFTSVVAAEEGLPPKPDPAMLLELCRKLGARPSDAVYVGDTALDARMALAAGLSRFHFAAYGYGKIESLVGLPVRGVIEDPRQLGRALGETE